MTYYSIDFETANDYPNSACSVGVVRFVNGIEQDSVYSLIKPPKMYFKPEYVNILLVPVENRHSRVRTISWTSV